MSNGQILVSAQEMVRVAGDVEAQVARYKTNYDRIYNEVDNLSTTWTGEANHAFTTQVRGFQSDFESMRKLLDKYAEFLRMAANNYTRVEQVNINNAATELRFGN
jgi:WXG100 family type VII secretion target